MAVEARLAPPWIYLDTFTIRAAEAFNDIRGRGRAPLHLLSRSQPNLPVDLSLSAPHVDPQLITRLVPDLELDKKSEAALQAKVHGLYPEISIDGSLQANFPEAKLKKYGLDLDDVVLRARSSGKTVEIMQCSAKTRKGSVSITGKSEWPSLNYKLVGQRVSIDMPKKLEVVADLDLLIDGDIEGPDIAGRIRLQEATYTTPKPDKKKKKKEEPQTEEQKEAAAHPSTAPIWLNTTMDVQARWPRNVWYRDGVSKIETNGNIRVQKDEGATMPYLTGTIGIVRGFYDVYGRDFKLNSGNLVFTGPPEINPLLSIQAEYAAAGNTVYLNIGGSAKAPTLALTSNPPMDQEDIIAILVVGQPLSGYSGASSSGTATSNQASAAALAGSVVGGYVANELRSSGLDLGLDVVRVQPGTSGGNVLTVGRYIGQKLFVSYGQPIQSQEGRLFNADYYLTSRWTLSGQSQAGGDSHMDMLFRYPLNAPKRGRQSREVHD